MAVTEFALSWSQSCGAVRSNNLSLEPADLCVAGGGFAVEQGLDTAIFMSLFFDARADDDDAENPTGDKTFGDVDARGWWGTELLRAAGLLGPDEEYGSHLWRFRRAKLTPRTLEGLVRACDEALVWLVSSGIASKVDVSIRVVVQGRADLLIVVHRNVGAPVQFSFVWDQMEGLSRG